MPMYEYLHPAATNLMDAKVGGVGLGGTRGIIGGIGAVGILGGTLAKASFMHKIPQNERALRLVLGRSQRTSDGRFTQAKKDDYYHFYEPRRMPVFTWPFAHSLLKVSIADRDNNLDNIQIMNKQGRQFDISSAIKWGIKDDVESVSKSHFNIGHGSNLDDMVVDIASAGLRAVTEGLSTKKLMRTKEIAGNLIDETREDLDHYGTRLITWLPKTVTPTIPDVLGHSMIEAARLQAGGGFDPARMGAAIVSTHMKGMPPELQIIPGEA